MTAKERAEQIVSEFKMILMEEDTECGNEILCTLIAIKCAKLIAILLTLTNSLHSTTGSKSTTLLTRCHSI